MDPPPSYIVSSQPPSFMSRHQQFRRNLSTAPTRYQTNLTPMKVLRQASIAIGLTPTNTLPSYQEHVFSSVKSELKCRRNLSLPYENLC